MTTHGDGKSWFITRLGTTDHSGFAIFRNKQRFACVVRSQKTLLAKNEGQHCFQATRNLIGLMSVRISRFITCLSALCLKPVNKELV